MPRASRSTVPTAYAPSWSYCVSLVRERAIDGDKIVGPADVARVAGPLFDGLDREQFVVLLLNTRNRVIGSNVVSLGTLDASIVHPRETFKAAVILGASAIIMVHNHPSGDPTPSREDLAITKRMVKAGEVLGIAVLDHVILGEGCHFSLKEGGML